MAVPSVRQRLMPIAQRRRDVADRIAELKGQLRIAQGIQVLHVCTCGHSGCGAPMPSVLPADAWVVVQGCRMEVPQQVTPGAIAEQVELSTPLTAQQQADHQALLELAKQFEQSAADPSITVLSR